MIATDNMVWDNEISAIMDDDESEHKQKPTTDKMAWDSEISDIMDGKGQPHKRAIPRLGASSKDTARMHREKPKRDEDHHDHHHHSSSNDTGGERVGRVHRTRSREDHPPKHRSDKSNGLRRCHTTDGTEPKRGSPKGGPRRGRKPPSDLTSSTTSTGALERGRTGSLERERSGRSLSPKPHGEQRRPRSNSPNRRRGEQRSGSRDRKSDRQLNLLEDDDDDDIDIDIDIDSSANSGGGGGGGRRSPSGERRGGLPPKQHSGGSHRSRSGSPRNPPVRGIPRPQSTRTPKSRRNEMERAKSNQSLVFRRPIEARRQKSARTLGLRKTKSLDESNSEELGWRKNRRDLNSSSKLSLEASSSNFLDTDSSNFLDSSLDDGEEEDVSIDFELKDSNSPNSGGGRSQGGGGRTNSPRSRHRTNKGRGNDISRNQLTRGIELQDQRIREEEEEEARKKRHQAKKQNSGSRNRGSPSSSRQKKQQQRGGGGQEGEASTRLINFATPKIAVPNIAAPKLINDTAVAASQAVYGTANAATQAANAASQATYQAATAASQTAYQAAIGSAAAATQAANVMSGAAVRAAAVLTFQSTTNNASAASVALGPAPKPQNQKSTVSERELAARFNFNSKAGSSAFGSSSLRESTNSDRPMRNQRSEEFTAGNGLQLF